MAEVGLIEDGAVLVEDDKIIRVGSTRQLENVKEARDAHVIEAHGKVVMPGFIDSCTQLMSGAPLFDDMETASRWQGAGRSPDDAKPDRLGRCRSIRNVSPSVLRSSANRWIGIAAASGTTSLEIRSAQGLHMHTEMKVLRAVRALDGEPLDIQPVALAGPSSGDSFPAPEQAAAAVVDALIPQLIRRKLTRHLAVDTGPAVFGLDGLRRILATARDVRLRLKFQMKVADTDTIGLAIEMGAAAVDHLTSAGDEEIAALATSDLIATLLPPVSLQQEGPFAPARDLIDAGGAVALASGFGATGGRAINMATVMSLACSQMRLSPAEALIATTVNAASVLGRSSIIGTLEPGRQADLAIFDVADYREIPYYLGSNLCVLTMKKGRVVHSARSAGLTPKRPPQRAGIVTARMQQMGDPGSWRNRS